MMNYLENKDQCRCCSVKWKVITMCLLTNYVCVVMYVKRNVFVAVVVFSLMIIIIMKFILTLEAIIISICNNHFNIIIISFT